MTSNAAAWIEKANDNPLNVREAPYWQPEADEVLIKVDSVAINPADWFVQEHNIFPTMPYPNVLGEDVAGEVVEAGSGVTSLKKGQRVFALVRSGAFGSPREGAFQHFSIAKAVLCGPLPASVDYANGCVMPLGLGTAAAGLFSEDHLHLPLPSASPQRTGQVLLIWSGSTSVGCNSIQLAKASGVEVMTTASSHNHQMLKALGADHCFDLNSKTVVEEVVQALKGKTVVGAYNAYGFAGTAQLCAKVLEQCSGRKFVSSAQPPPEDIPVGVECKFVNCLSIMDNGVGEALFHDYLPRALEKGTYVAAPKAKVVGQGLESIQKGFDAQKAGVSATKIVVKL